MIGVDRAASTTTGTEVVAVAGSIADPPVACVSSAGAANQLAGSGGHCGSNRIAAGSASSAASPACAIIERSPAERTRAREIGRGGGRERVGQYVEMAVVGGYRKKKKT